MLLHTNNFRFQNQCKNFCKNYLHVISFASSKVLWDHKALFKDPNCYVYLRVQKVVKCNNDRRVKYHMKGVFSSFMQLTLWCGNEVLEIRNQPSFYCCCEWHIVLQTYLFQACIWYCDTYRKGWGKCCDTTLLSLVWLLFPFCRHHLSKITQWWYCHFNSSLQLILKNI